MKICYRDELGPVIVEIDTAFVISFDGQYAYFNDTEGRDYRVNVKDIVMIGKE